MNEKDLNTNIGNKKNNEPNLTSKIKNEGIEHDFDALSHIWNINLEKEVASQNRVFLFIKKIVRKLTRWNIKSIEEEQINFNSRIARVSSYLKGELEQINERLKKLELIESENHFSMDYLAFENKYRGTEEAIEKLQNKFLVYFENRDNIVDIGCGRGEFIKLLLKAGKKKVLGLDLNSQMIEKCQNEKLPVQYLDGVKYLIDNQNLELGGIFSSQVIEHLKPSQILKLVKGAYKNLKSEGVLILETINPMCLLTHTLAYPLDLTHKQLVHPYTMEMILKEQGFSKIEIVYSSFSDPDPPFLEIEGIEKEKLEKYNKKIKKSYDLLYGYQDYAIIAWK